MNIVFFGTPDYVIPLLDALAKHHKIVAVVTKPPKIAGREKLKVFSPVDTWAHKKKVPIYFESAKIVEDRVEADLGVLAAYGEFIPKKVINYFKYGIINIHPSLLPKWRGASPVQAAIAADDKVTGVTIIRLDELMDHGPVISSFSEEIKPDDTTASLRERLFQRSTQFLIDLIPNYVSGKIKPKDQDHDKATFTKILKKEDGFIDLNKTEAATAERFVRAMQPWPAAWTLLRLDSSGQAPKRIKILKAHLERQTPSTQKLVPDLVQLEGKNPVTWEQFKQGHPEAKFT